MTTTSKVYGNYVVFVESKALRRRSKQEYLRQVRKLGMRHQERSLKQISERMLLDHLIHLRDKEKLRPSTLNQAVVALRLFYHDYLQRLAVVGAVRDPARSAAADGAHMR